MSSILNALKKLEQETLEKKTEPTTSMNLNIRQQKNSWKKRATLKSSPWAWIISLALLCLGAGGFLIFFPDQKPKQTAMGIKIAKNPAPVPIPTGTYTKPKTENRIPLKPKPRETVTLAPKRPIQTTNLAVPQEQPHQVATPHESRPKIKSPPPLEQSVKPPPKIYHPAPLQASIPPIHEIVSQEIQILEDGSLKINAISWSKNPDKRLAVINSTIVREGQTVEEFKIVKIEENQVIVQQSQKKWRVVFRLR